MARPLLLWHKVHAWLDGRLPQTLGTKPIFHRPEDLRVRHRQRLHVGVVQIVNPDFLVRVGVLVGLVRRN